MSDILDDAINGLARCCKMPTQRDADTMHDLPSTLPWQAIMFRWALLCTWDQVIPHQVEGAIPEEYTAELSHWLHAWDVSTNTHRVPDVLQSRGALTRLSKYYSNTASIMHDLLSAALANNDVPLGATTHLGPGQSSPSRRGNS